MEVRENFMKHRRSSGPLPQPGFDAHTVNRLSDAASNGRRLAIPTIVFLALLSIGCLDASTPPTKAPFRNPLPYFPP